ncbi:uncharacterized protein ELE39_001101 [Cryptosporidium sp. chipmunk genotype I]|uniref:uncharacterized protein n=1 Tax=Cryptosporidium sp. chipmunk genotype I TaxID=1280935 RepID=UPI00351AA2BD|nr:hypothetical protein ELE39_001101 [Cryptosporidium sp. chipmunk genotype I]
MKASLVLTTDVRFEGAQLCTLMEDELMENAEGGDITHKMNNSLGRDLNSNNLIELVVTNSEQEEVTLFVTEAVYNLIYRKPDLRKNPNTFHRAKTTASTDGYQNNITYLGEVESMKKVIYIKKYDSFERAGKNVPVIQAFNYSHIQFSTNSSSGPVSTVNTYNFTNSSESE